MGPALVALAAGVGSRYGGLKQLERVGPSGETLLEYSVYDAIQAGFQRVVLLVSPDTEAACRQSWQGGMGGCVPLTFVQQTLTDLPAGFATPPERTKPWGTAHAILAARHSIEGMFAVINADDFYGAASFRALHEFLDRPQIGSAPSLSMVGFEVGATLTWSGPVSRALCRRGADGRLEEIVEIAEVWKTSDGGWFATEQGRRVEIRSDHLVSMNMWGFLPQVFTDLSRGFEAFLSRWGRDHESEYRIPDVIQELMRAGRHRVEVLPQRSQWCGITHRGDEERARKFIQSLVDRGDYPPALWR